MQHPQTSPQSFDTLDFRIIRALSDDPRLSNAALAAQLQVAESTCSYRVRRLRESRIITPGKLGIDYVSLGYPLRAIVLVFLTRHSREVVDEFMQHMVQQPNVLSVMNLTGRYDFMVTVAVADPDQLRTFVLDHVTVLPSVRGTETHIVFNVQEGTWIPGAPEQ